MTNDSLSKKLGLQDIDDRDDINAKQHIRKRDKVREFLGIPKTKTRASNELLNAGLLLTLPVISSQPQSDNNPSGSLIVPADKPTSTSPPPSAETKRPSDIFLENIPKPSLMTDLPALGARIEKTEQLVYCNALLLQDSSPQNTVDTAEEAANTSANVPQMRFILTEKEIEWLAEMDKNPIEKAHIRWLATRMVEEFIQDGVKDSAEIAEIVALGPVLDREPYRKLLSCLIGKLEDARILDTDVLQGLVQLVQSASTGYLVSDDLIRILRILRTRLEGTHQQTHSFHLTLAVSRVLGVMADHEVKDLNRVQVHEPLSGILSELKGSSDPYLMYQACYAYQALQYIPDDDTVLQTVLRHSKGIANGLVRISRLVKFDLDVVTEGLGDLKETAAGVYELSMPAYEGLRSVMENGRGVLENLQDGYGSGSGKKHPWYAAICAAYALVEAGQLKDLNRLIYEAPCRRDPLFQWGACQLLGEIASDAIWNTAVRQQAAKLLGELCRNDPEWGQDESVKAWMLSIIVQLATVPDQAVAASAHILLQELKQDHDTTHLPYPLRNRLPSPKFSSILARVQNIILVEYDLNNLKLQRLEEHKKAVYIPPQAKPNLQATDNILFPLMEKALEFLAGHRQVFLVLGDSGAGKSTFNLELEYTLWKDYKKNGPIPLYVNLPTIDDPAHDLIEKQLQYHNFSDDEIQEMRRHREFILICDGYDESQLKVNLYTTNEFNQAGQWKARVVISCRSQYLGQDYKSRFQPQSVDHYQGDPKDLFEEAVVAAFTRGQIQQYVEEYVKELPAVDPIQNKPSWTVEEYMDKLVNIPHLMDLVSNPFLLSLSLNALPAVVESKADLSAIRITRVQLYDSFVRRWLEVNRKRLEESPLSHGERSELDLLVDDDFFYHGIQFQKNFAMAIFTEHKGNPVVKYTHLHDRDTWKSAFFAPEGQAKLLRESSTVMRTGAFFRFLHRSLLEYFYSRTIYEPRDYDSEDDEPCDRGCTFDFKICLGRMTIIKEPSILQFLAERVSQDLHFKQQLLDAIEESKADEVAKAIKIAAANAISILVKAGVLFNDVDLRDVKIPGADLSGGQFDSVQFQGANLTGVDLSRCWLRQADMSNAQLEGVGFGELPYLEMDDGVTACVYSPDGRMLAVASESENRYIYDTTTWERIRQLEGKSGRFDDIAFSVTGQWLVYGGKDYTVRLMDCTSGEEVLVMEGHTYDVLAVAVSPCGGQIASGAHDSTVRLWNSLTGESAFVLEGHTGGVISVKYSPDGRQLVSASWDETIRLWNPQTGEPGIELSHSLGDVHSLAYSPDGRWIASGHGSGTLQLWDAVTRESGPVLRGHTDSVTRIVFSPNGQRIASASFDKTARLWDASSGTLISSMTGHSNYVNCVTFSPDGYQIASGGWDKKVRLWKVGSSWSTLDRRDGGSVGQVAFALGGETILSYDSRQNFRQWDPAAGTYVSTPIALPGPEEVSSTAFALDGSEFAVGYEDFSTRLWNCQTGTAGPVLEEHAARIEKLVYSPCCRWIASVDENNYLRFCDRHDSGYQSFLVELNEEEEVEIGGVAFSSTGDQVAIGASEEGTIYLYDTRSREFLSCCRLIEGEENLMTLAYSPDDKQLAFGTGDGPIYLWDLQSETPSAKLEGHEKWILCIGYSPCGQWIASGGNDKTVRIWRRKLDGEEESWSCVYSLHAFFASVDSVSWNPVVPMELVTGCKDGSVRMWRVSIVGSDGDDGEGERVEVKLLWGSNLGILCAYGLVLEDATGLGSFDQKLLMQQGATGMEVGWRGK